MDQCRNGIEIDWKSIQHVSAVRVRIAADPPCYNKTMIKWYRFPEVSVLVEVQDGMIVSATAHSRNWVAGKGYYPPSPSTQRDWQIWENMDRCRNGIGTLSKSV